MADLLVFPSGTVVDQYDRTAGGHLNDSVGGAETADSLVRGLNQIRVDAGLEKGDARSRRERHGGKGRTPFLCSAGRSCPQTVADQVILGLRAGWQVPGLVAHGQLRRASRATWLILGASSSALNHPSGRERLAPSQG